ncbi:MAG TPA: hypothetical protein VFI28_13265, partial [Candidatus Limnocylindrales bacterium]|nr:hypothetical protein [Candidatus Limnocylindrales bacterium]
MAFEPVAFGLVAFALAAFAAGFETGLVAADALALVLARAGARAGFAVVVVVGCGDVGSAGASVVVAAPPVSVACVRAVRVRAARALPA